MIAAFVTSLVLSAAATWMLLPVLRRSLPDLPNERSSHSSVVPRGGGLSVAVITLAITVLWPHSTYNAWQGSLVALVAVAAIGAVGLIDDLRGLNPVPRLVVQGTAAGTIAISLLGMSPQAVVAALLVVALVNAVNFMDGINGITAIWTSLAAAWYGLALNLSPHSPIPLILAVTLSGASAGFLLLNIGGRVFLGDVGSYFIGAALALLVLSCLVAEVPFHRIAAPLLIPAFDTLWTVSGRIRRGKNPLEAHREHIYQKLASSGLRHATVAALVGLLTLCACAASYLRPPFAYGAWTLIATTYVNFRRLQRTT